MVKFPRQSNRLFGKAAGDKAKEQAKKFSKARSAIKMAHKSIEMSSTVTQETIDKAHAMIAELEKMMEEGTAPQKAGSRNSTTFFEVKLCLTGRV